MPTLGQLISQIASSFANGSAVSFNSLLDEDLSNGGGNNPFSNFINVVVNNFGGSSANNSVMQNLFSQSFASPAAAAPAAYQEAPAPTLNFASPFASNNSAPSSGNFTLTGPINNAVISGDGGDNTITGTPDPDTLSGLGGNDTIYGMDSGDTIYGGTGNDIIFAYDNTTGDGTGGSGSVTDYFEGFDGGTSGYIYSELDGGGVNVNGFHNGGDGDTANGSLEIEIERTGTFGFSYGIYSQTINITQDMTNAELTFSYRHRHNNQNDNGEDSYIWSQLNSGGYDLINTALGSGGTTDTGWVTYTYNLGSVTAGDTITIDLAHGHSGANGNNEESYGRFDDVTIIGDVITGGGGGAPSNTLDAGTVNTLYGEDGDDNMYGAAGNDIMYGGNDNDYLFGGYGDDTLNGGAGTDILDGSFGTDTLDYSGSNAAVTVNIASNTVSGGHATGDTISNFENIRGSDHNDNLTGDGNSNVIEGGDGADIINAAGGDDIVYGGDGADTINGGAGADTLHGTAALDVDAILAANPNVVYNAGTGSFYQWVNNGSNIRWNDADAAANSATLSGAPTLSGHLATVTTQAESDFIDSIRDGSNSWLAGSDEAIEGEWVWNRGSESNVRFSDNAANSVNGMYVDWVAGQPNDGAGNQNYMYILENGGTPGWADAPENPWVTIPTFVDIFSYVIEWEAGTGSDDNAADTINGDAGDDIIYGHGGNDILDGGADNDVLYGGDGNDTINGGTGDDDIYGGSGADTIDGGAGTDSVYYNNETSDLTINLDGTANSGGEAAGDTLINVEVVYAGSGADTFNGATGNASVYGGDGDDTFYAGAGNDLHVGDGDYDTIYFSGFYGDYSIVDLGTVGGIDSLLITDLNVGDGNDGADTIVTIERLVFQDVIIDISDPTDYEYSPTDIILSSDTFSYTQTAGATIATLSSVDLDVGDTHTYSILGGDDDIFTIVGNELRLTVDANNFQNDVFYLDLQTTDSFGFTYSEGVFVHVLGPNTTAGDGGGNLINGTAADEGLYGFGGNDIINGGDGDDSIFGGDGADIMDGGAGFDIIHFDTARSNLTINLSTNSVSGDTSVTGDVFVNFEGASGGIGNDTITGTTGKNFLYGNRGNDTINGGDGDDRIWGGDGADILDGGAGFDWLRYDYDIAGVTVNLGTGSAIGGHAQGDTFTNFEGVAGGIGNDTLIGGTGHDRLDGNGGNDILTGNAGNDVIYGGAGNDTITGGDGNDNVYGEDGADSMDGGAGTDTLRYESDMIGVTVNLATGIGSGGQAQGDTFTNFENLNGGYGNDSLTGDTGNNVINGRDGDDIIYGGDGNDTIHGNDGADQLYGEAGNDILYSGVGAEILNGGTGIDTVRIFDTAAITVNLATGTASGGVATGDTLVSIENVDTGSGDDNITGSADNNRIKGNNGNDTIHGGDGNDFLDGGNDNDILNGDAGNDRLYGQAGNDILNGGAGNDILYGGAGLDTFIFDTTDTDRVDDFNVGEGDILDISGLLSGFTGGSDINDFLVFEVVSGRTNMMVDQNGAVGGQNLVHIGTLDNHTSLDVQTLYDAGQIIA